MADSIALSIPIMLSRGASLAGWCVVSEVLLQWMWAVYVKAELTSSRKAGLPREFRRRQPSLRQMASP
jgi:hypothetical protein